MIPHFLDELDDLKRQFGDASPEYITRLTSVMTELEQRTYSFLADESTKARRSRRLKLKNVPDTTYKDPLWSWQSRWDAIMRNQANAE